MRRAALLLLLLLSACGEAPRALVGEPYQLGGRWYYPREDFSYTATGLASVLPDRTAGRRTANGEIHDPAALMAAHRTLQLPAILRVTNLETGRSLRVRLNDRGPADPGREVALSRRAAELLGVPPGGAAQVRIAVEQEDSRALAAAAPRPAEAAPLLPIATAPRPRLEGEEARQGARLLDADDALDALLPRLGRQHAQIRMRAGGDAAEHRVRLRHMQRRRPVRGPPGQKPAQEADGERRLSHPLRPREKPGMVQPPAGGRLGQHRRLRGVADEFGRLRRGEALAHGSSPGRRSASTAAMRAATVSASASASTTAQRPGSAAAMARKPARTRSWKSRGSAS